MPVSPYQVMAGTVIPAGLVTGIKSDLPGDVIATVTETVYDTATGRYPLIPQGSRLIGRYNSQVSYGQTRIQIVWHRIILPDTSSVQLDNLVGSDPAGYAGLEDGVDWHWDRIFANAALTTLLGIGAKLGRPREPPGRQPRHHRRPRQRAGHDEPDQPGGDAPQPEHPTYLDESARPADARHRQPRPGASAVPAAVLQQGSITMSTNELRLGPLPSSISVKLTFTCPASLKADLDRYAALHAQTYGEAVDAATLIPHMLEAFMARDRGFKRTSIKT